MTNSPGEDHVVTRAYDQHRRQTLVDFGSHTPPLRIASGTPQGVKNEAHLVQLAGVSIAEQVLSEIAVPKKWNDGVS